MAPSSKKEMLLLAASLCLLSISDGFTTSERILTSLRHCRRKGCCGRHTKILPAQWLSVTKDFIEDTVQVPTNSFFLSLVAVAGLDPTELSSVVSAVEEAYHQGVGASIPCDTSETITFQDPVDNIPGALGRVALVYSNLDEDSIDELQQILAAVMDPLVYSEPATLRQPVLISVQNKIPDGARKSDKDCQRVLMDVVEREVDGYELAKPLGRGATPRLSDSSYLPSLRVELDGAMIVDPYSSDTFWDTSSVVIFDNIVSDDLRRRLLQVSLGSKDSNDDRWDDIRNGPDPNRWLRGGLMDIPDEEIDSTEGGNKSSEPIVTSCWGLRDEAIAEICDEQHEAVSEMEGILANLFPQFIVSRLPEAVFGECVSPLTANAPTSGDSFQYHIDGDPFMTPPSPWTDVYGRYPNRLRGKPRLMSFLVYLNDEWNEEWGAPTQFLDIPTDRSYEILPRPCRCVLMDQDLSHTVVAPTELAGNRPRYSLVWKLILHPKTPCQHMTDLSGNRDWPDPILYGSACKQEKEK